MLTNTLISQVAETHGPLTFGAERRTHVRVGFDCPVRWGGAGQEHFGWAKDASECGAGFLVPAHGAPAVGDRIRVVFRLDNCWDWLVDKNASVRWSVPVDGGLYHVGVRFAAKPRGPDEPEQGSGKPCESKPGHA
ncbi:MAG TPA: PilZ domain-containing protein [Phycisphaerae bacterium]|nr:PilZ domain-containing protein [Phycisphaerae bacterium]